MSAVWGMQLCTAFSTLTSMAYRKTATALLMGLQRGECARLWAAECKHVCAGRSGWRSMCISLNKQATEQQERVKCGGCC